uniref:Uncharacterized protein n=1 Tax=Rhizophora mucronata TaxID=61149 RepID=A0A2P2IN87_RHIMU
MVLPHCLPSCKLPFLKFFSLIQASFKMFAAKGEDANVKLPSKFQIVFDSSCFLCYNATRAIILYQA